MVRIVLAFQNDPSAPSLRNLSTEALLVSENAREGTKFRMHDSYFQPLVIQRVPGSAFSNPAKVEEVILASHSSSLVWAGMAASANRSAPYQCPWSPPYRSSCAFM